MRKNYFVSTVPFVRDRDNIATRAIQVREAYGFAGHGGQKRFAEFLGVIPQRWGHVETGQAGLGIDLALLVVQKCPGVTLEWLYRGHADTLTPITQRRLGLLGGPPKPPDVAS